MQIAFAIALLQSYTSFCYLLWRPLVGKKLQKKENKKQNENVKLPIELQKFDFYN